MEINLKPRALALAALLAMTTGLPSQLSAETRDQDSVEASLKKSVAEGNAWKRLLHYRNGLFSREQSEIDGREFFLSPNGKTDALAELEATLQAFKAPASEKVGLYQQHPQCVYPGRFRFLTEQLKLKISKLPCPEFETWKSGVQARAVTLVYAAPYLGNPASLFGHTFLRIGSGEKDLVDAAVSFDALPTTDGGLVFAMKGLTGGYHGQFSQQPYYLKIKTYSQLENRDLWEFKLALSPDQIERLVGHLWELGATYFDYYFFDENCSYQLLSLLEVAEPRWDLRRRFDMKTVPLDTVRAVDGYEGAIETIKVRTSLYGTFSKKRSALSRDDKKTFERVRRNSSDLKGDESSAVLDALIDWNQYQTENRADGGQPFETSFEQKLLLARAALPKMSEDSQEKRELPQNGHRSSKLSFSVRSDGSGDERRTELGIGIRPVLHDLLDADLGYVPYSNLIIGETNLVYLPQSGKVALDGLTFAEMLNLQPMSDLRHRPSFRAAARLQRPRDLGCLDCIAGSLSAGYGASVLIARDSMLIAALLNVGLESSNAFLDRYGQLVRYAPGIEVRALVNVADDTKLELKGENTQFFSRVPGDVVSWTRASATVAVPLRVWRSEVRLAADLQFIHETERASMQAFWGYYF